MLYALNSDPDGSSQVLWEDGERVFCRGSRVGDNDNRSAVLVVLPAAEHPSRLIFDRLAHEYALKDELDGAWAVRPLELTNDGARPVLVLDDTGGEALHRLLGAPMDVGGFLRLAIGITTALGKLHQRGLVHKDIKAGQHPGQRHDRRGEAHRVWYRLAPLARTTGGRASRDARGHTCLHGARADRLDESLH